MACLTFTAADANRSSLISFAHSLIRSLILTTCGEVKEAVFFPCWVRSASKNAQTDPFPFVPATWITADGSDVTEDFIRYARPLIQGEVTVPTEDGVPKFAYRK